VVSEQLSVTRDDGASAHSPLAADRVSLTESVAFLDSTLGTLRYGEFLRQIHKQTLIPLPLLEKKIGGTLTRIAQGRE
jgi:hypothetical protein